METSAKLLLATSLYLLAITAQATPPALTNVVASQGTYKGYVQLSWDASPDPYVSRYSVYLTSNGTTPCGFAYAPSLSATCRSSSIAPKNYWVSAASNGGADIGPKTGPVSGFSAEFSLSAPTNVIASQGTHKGYVQLSWDASSDLTGQGAYAAYANGSRCGETDIGSPPPSSVTCATTDDVVRSYTVQTYSSAANKFSPDSIAVTGFGDTTPVLPPTNVSASQGTYDSSVALTWSASPDMLGKRGRYAIYADGSATPCAITALASPAALVAACYVGDEATHTYAIRGALENSSAFGDPSLPVTGFAYVPGEAPDNISASEGTIKGGVQLYWSEPTWISGDEFSGYQINMDYLGWHDAGMSNSFLYPVEGTDYHYFFVRATYTNKHPGEMSFGVIGFSAGGKKITPYVYRVKI